MNIRGAVCVVTGASEGIGRATATRLGSAGAKLVLAARSEDRLRSLTEELGRSGVESHVVRTDMRDRAQAAALLEKAAGRFGRIDVLVNNAGQSVAGLVESVSVDDFLKIVELNVFGPLAAMQAAIPLMRRGGGGIILNVSSMVSKMHIPGLGTYAATKAALNVLSETARDELARDNIRVITMFPRMTATNFGSNALGSQELRQRQRAAGGEARGAGGGAAGAPPVDPPEAVADRIRRAIEEEPAEQYMDR